MSALICVTPENVETVLSDLPRLARLAFGFGSKLRRGTLDVTLPDGRTLRLGGMEPGPSAAMTLTNYGFASRLLNGGDIGIAEAYLHGEWDTPDLTQFLYLFCVNQHLIHALQAGQKLVEIGCGWGGFAEYAAKTYGGKVVGLTISKEQRDFAQARIQNAGLGDKVEIRLQDYRDERDQYDRIASIEMIEAVGEQFWPKYFSQLRDRLLPGGLAGIQAITIQDRLFQTYRREVDFIQRYVFPGGMLPSPQVLKSLGERFGVPVIRERIFGQDYAKTLVTWRNNFRAAWPNLKPLGFDDRFRRLWEYCLAYCEPGFLSGNIDVRQVVFAKSK